MRPELARSLPDDVLETISSFGGPVACASATCFRSAMAEARQRLATRGACAPRFVSVTFDERALAAKGWGKLRYLMELARCVQAADEETVPGLFWIISVERTRVPMLCVGCAADFRLPFPWAKLAHVNFPHEGRRRNNRCCHHRVHQRPAALRCPADCASPWTEICL